MLKHTLRDCKMKELVFHLGVFTVFAAFVLGWIFLPVILHEIQQRHRVARGFEVKLTGRSPVLAEKEDNDHG